MSVKIKQHEELNFRVRFYSDRAKTQPIDPVTAVLTLSDPSGTDTNPTFLPEGSRPANLGWYSGSYIFEDFGDWNWEIVTDSPRIVATGKVQVTKSPVDE